MDKAIIEKAWAGLREHVKAVDEWCVKNDYFRVATFLIGSQNYGVSTLESDVDTKSIVVPKDFRSLLYNSRCSLNLMIPSTSNRAGEANIQDWITFIERLKKGNPQLIETLYTDFRDIANNEKCANAVGWLIENRDKIARYDEARTASALREMMNNALNKYSLSSPGPVRAKKAMHAVRLSYVLSWYYGGLDFGRCIGESHITPLLLRIRTDYSGMEFKTTIEQECAYAYKLCYQEPPVFWESKDNQKELDKDFDYITEKLYKAQVLENS